MTDAMTEHLARGEEEEARAAGLRSMAQEMVSLAEVVRHRGRGGSKAELEAYAKAHNIVGAVALARPGSDSLTAEDREAMKLSGLDEETYRVARRAMLDHADGSATMQIRTDKAPDAIHTGNKNGGRQ